MMAVQKLTPRVGRRKLDKEQEVVEVLIQNTRSAAYLSEEMVDVHSSYHFLIAFWRKCFFQYH
jgi:hypothetical protein